jgi:hypothetical protein
LLYGFALIENYEDSCAPPSGQRPREVSFGHFESFLHGSLLSGLRI